MKATPAAHGAISLLLEPKEAEILGLMIANEVVGEVGHGEPGLAEGLREVGSGEPYWGRPTITLLDAAQFSYDLLQGLGGFTKAQGIIATAIVEEEADAE